MCVLIGFEDFRYVRSNFRIYSEGVQGTVKYREDLFESPLILGYALN